MSNSTALQWGHGEFAVENWIGSIQHGRPRRLQWGHGEFAVENLPAPSREWSGQESLQWGHGEFAVENVGHADGKVGAGVASMGPRRIRRGERMAVRLK